MTTDALLNILLVVIIPLLMAALGGILAARALPSTSVGGKRNPEIWIWTSAFVLIFLVSVVLALVQQVRTTSQQQTADAKAHEKELRDNGEIKYMQGRLDSIEKLLSNLSGSSDPKQTAAILKGILPLLAGEPSLHIFYQNQNLEGQTIKIPFRVIRTGPGAPPGFIPEKAFNFSGISIRNTGTRTSEPINATLCFSKEVIPQSISWAWQAVKDNSDAQFPFCIPMAERKQSPIFIKGRDSWDVPPFSGTVEGWNSFEFTAQLRITNGGERLVATFTLTSN